MDFLVPAGRSRGHAGASVYCLPTSRSAHPKILSPKAELGLVHLGISRLWRGAGFRWPSIAFRIAPHQCRQPVTGKLPLRVGGAWFLCRALRTSGCLSLAAGGYCVLVG